VAGFCEQGNDPPGFIKKAGYFFDILCDSFSNLTEHHGVKFLEACTLMKVVLPFMAVHSCEIT
jgi:hypothetical protein